MDDAKAIQTLIDDLNKSLDDLNIPDVDVIATAATTNNPFLGDWEKKTGQGWKPYTIKPDGTAVTAEGEKGTWKIEKNALYIKWPTQINMYNLPVNGVMTGHTVPAPGDDQIPLKSRRPLKGDDQQAAQK